MEQARIEHAPNGSLLTYITSADALVNDFKFMAALSRKCRQRERISLRDGLRLPSNSKLKIIRPQLPYKMKPEGSLYMCIKFQSKVTTQ